jgi:hypothetical protein
LNAVAATRRRETVKSEGEVVRAGKAAARQAAALTKKFLRRKMRALKKSE